MVYYFYNFITKYNIHYLYLKKNTETAYSSLVNLGNAFAGLANGNAMISQGSSLVYNSHENQLLALQKYPQSNILSFIDFY